VTLLSTFALAPALVLFLAVPPVVPPAPGPSVPAASATGENVLKDRVMAIVDEDPILASDVERIVGLGLAPPNPGESARDLRRRVLGQLIDERLRFHEIDRYGFEQVPVSQVDEQVQELRTRSGGEEGFKQRLKDVGLTLAGLRQLLSRQLMVLAYVDERLGPRVFVSQDDIATYYKDVLTPELQKAGKPAPPLEESREPIRAVLKEQLLNKEIATWTEELRRKADILNYFDEDGKPLPPVVRMISGKKKPG
jgi:peptidyl-prolyl cis-trans isomerase SurA